MFNLLIELLKINIFKKNKSYFHYANCLEYKTYCELNLNKK